MKVVIHDEFWNSLEYMCSKRKRIKDFFRSIKNRILKPYTTIKPRYLGHNWTDHVDILPHMMFESLSIFIEKECSPECVEWYGEYPHMIMVGMEWKNVRDEMQDLYDWWHQEYIPYWMGDTDIKFEGEDLEINEFFIALNKDPKDRTKKERDYFDYLSKLNQQQFEMDRELQSKMNRLIRLRRYMWT